MTEKAELEAFAMSRGARDCSVMISMAVVEKIEKELPASCFSVPYISKFVCVFFLSFCLCLFLFVFLILRRSVDHFED